MMFNDCAAILLQCKVHLHLTSVCRIVYGIVFAAVRISQAHLIDYQLRLVGNGCVHQCAALMAPICRFSIDLTFRAIIGRHL